MQCWNCEKRKHIGAKMKKPQCIAEPITIYILSWTKSVLCVWARACMCVCVFPKYIIHHACSGVFLCSSEHLFFDH